MRARGLASDIEPIWIAAERSSILIYPDDGASHLIGHHADVAFGFERVVEVERDIMGARVRDVLGGEVILLRGAGPPSAAMDEDQHRRVRPLGAENVELFDLGRTIGQPLWLTEAAPDF